jgi:cellulose biosynthesis protein BcsQ
MTQIISVFNNKGGVGKTTLTWNIGDALARRGKKVLLIDFDPQCNLSLAMLGEDTFSKKLPTQNVPYGTTMRAYLQRFLQGTGGSEIFLQEGEDNKTHQNVKLIAGDFWLNAYGEALNRGADLLTGTGISKYVVLTKIVEEASKENNGEFDFVLIDLPPSFGTLVRAALYSSNYYIVPCTSDTFSAYCVSLIGEMLPAFKEDWKIGISSFKRDNPRFNDYDHLGIPKFAGWIFNGFDTRGRDGDGEEKKIKADQVHYDRIAEAIKKHLINNTKIECASGILGDGILGQTEDMNTLIQNSIWLNVPIGQLKDHKPIKTLRDRTSWAENQLSQIKLLRGKFEEIAKNIEEHCV